MRLNKKKYYINNLKVFALFTLVIFLLIHNISYFKTYKIVSDIKEGKEARIIDIKDEIYNNFTKIEYLQTERGKERELVERFSHLREDERILILVE